MTFYCIELKDHQHFLSLTNEFDTKFNCTTSLFQMTLKEINYYFLKRNIHDYLTALVSGIFLNSNHIYSNDAQLAVDDTIKMYTFYKIVKDLQNNIGMLHPINLHYFGQNRVGVHPGNSRLNFLHQYFQPVDVVLTDYTNTYKNNHSSNDIDFGNKNLSFMSSMLEDNRPRSIFNVSRNSNTVYKECKHIPTTNVWRNVQENILYCLLDNKVYVNDTVVLYKKKNKWWFNV